MSNLFKQIINLKNRFGAISEENFNVVNSILSSDNFSSDRYIKFRDDYSARFVGGTRTIDIYNNDGVLVESHDITYLDNCYNEVLTIDPSLTVGDVLDNVSNGANFYEKLSLITSKYSYMNTQQFSDVVNILNTGSMDDKSSFIKLLGAATGADGKLSIHSWMAVVQEFFNSIYTAVKDDEAVELDDSNPYKNSNIIDVILSAVSAVFNVLMLVLKGVFQVIVIIIGLIVKFFSALNDAIKNKTKTAFNPSVNNLFVAGPIFSNALNTESFTMQFGNDSFKSNFVDLNDLGDVPHDRRIYYRESNGIGCFCWYDTDYNKTNINCYMYPDIDVRRLNINNFFIHDNVNNTPVLKVQGFMDIGTYRCLSEDDLYNNFPHYDETHIPQNNNEIILSLMFGIFLRSYVVSARLNRGSQPAQWVIHQKHSTGTQAHPNVMNIYNPGWTSTTPVAYLHSNSLYGADITRKVLWHFTAFMSSWLSCGVENMNDTYTLDYFESHLNPTGQAAYDAWIQEMAEDLTEYMRDYAIKNNSSLLADFESVPGSDPSSATYYWPGAELPLAGSHVQSFWMFGNEINLSLYAYNKTPNSHPEDTLSIDANCLPCDFGILLPTLIDDNVYTLLAISALAITAIAVTAATVSRFVSKTMIAKKTVSKNKIADLRQKFLDDPDNVIKKKEYVDAVYKYNRFGKIFGYGSYDVGNSWFDGSSGGQSSSDSLATSLSQYYQDKNQANQQSIQTSVDTSNTDIKKVIDLIKS